METKDSFISLYTRLLAENGLPAVYVHSADKLWALTQALQTANQVMNLTALRTVEDIVWKHLIDSLTAASLLPGGASVLDVGTGAGFPALPLAIARPDLRVTAVDATQKKVNFIRNTIQLLSLSNLSAESLRVEEATAVRVVGKKAESGIFREKYDVVISRAVARLEVLDELTLPACRVGGFVLAMKGESGNAERMQAEKGIEMLGGEVEREITFSIRNGDKSEERDIIFIRKVRPTPALYPRRYAKIAEQPL